MVEGCGSLSSGPWPLAAALWGDKGANRAAVHGVKPPLKDTIRVDEEVEKEIEKGKEEKEKKRREVEKAVNSQAKTSKE